MTLAALKRKLKKYQKQFKLTEWSINLVFAPQEGREAPDTAGASYWQTEYKVATIEIDSAQPDDEVEETLVHELLHLCLEGHKPLTRGYKYDAQYEYALNILSSVIAKRR